MGWSKNEIRTHLSDRFLQNSFNVETLNLSHDYTGISLTLHALDGSEEFDFVETRVLV